MSTTDHANPPLPIFGCQQKSELIDYCAGLEVSSRDLLEIVLRGRARLFQPYNTCHILDTVPDELGLSTDDLLLLSRASSAKDWCLRIGVCLSSLLDFGHQKGLHCAHVLRCRLGILIRAGV